MNASYSPAAILKRGVLNSLAFCIIWGGWAYYANAAHGQEAAAAAAKAQILFTSVNAFVYSIVMEAIFGRIKPAALRNAVTFAVPNVMVTVMLSGIHWLAGTPEIISTVLPPLLIIYSLCLVYIFAIGPRKLREDTPLPA
jgi:hypothetical protein